MRIKVFSLLALLIIAVAGCSTIPTEAAKFDVAIQTLMASDDKALTPECRAGAARGITSGATVDPAINATIITMEANLPEPVDVNKKKACTNWGAWVAFRIRGLKAKADEVIPSTISFVTEAIAKFSGGVAP